MTTKERYEGVLGWFAGKMPVAESELKYNDPFELIVAVILSAQCTDKRVNMTTPALFERFPDAKAMAAGTITKLSICMKWPKNWKGIFREKCLRIWSYYKRFPVWGVRRPML